MAKVIVQDRDQVRMRFLIAMRQIIAVRNKDVKTVSDFAGLVGEHQQNISKMENGDRYPTIDQLIKLCDVFGISDAWILRGKGNMVESADVSATLAVLQQRIEQVETEIQELKKKAKK